MGVDSTNEYDYEYKNTSIGQELSQNNHNDCWFYEYVLPVGLGGRKECKIVSLDFSLNGAFDDSLVNKPVNNYEIGNNITCNNTEDTITYDDIDSNSKDIVPILSTTGKINTCYFCDSIKSLRNDNDPLTREPFSSENKERIKYYCDYKI